MTEHLVPSNLALSEVPAKVKDLLTHLNEVNEATLNSPYTLGALQCLSTALQLANLSCSASCANESLTEQLVTAVADPLGSQGVQAIYRGAAASGLTALGDVKFVPESLLAVLNSAAPNVAQWLYILTELHGTGLKVPPEQLVPFLLNYLRLLPRLNRIDHALPLELVPLGAGAERSDAGPDWLAQVTRDNQLCALLRRCDLDALLTWLDADLRGLPYDEQARLLNLLADHWWLILNAGYQAKWWPSDKALDEAASAQRLQALLQAKLEVDHEALRLAALRLMRLIPGSSYEEQVLSFLRAKLAGPKDGKARPKFSNLARIVLPDAPTELSTEQRSLCLKLLVPPAQLFELMKLERTGDEAQDATTLAVALARRLQAARYLQCWHLGQDLLFYLISRIKYELGATYLDAFYRQCAASIPTGWAVALCRLVRSAELETLPWIADNYSLCVKWCAQPWRLVFFSGACNFVHAFDFLWGPKFSARLAHYLEDGVSNSDSGCWEACALALDPETLSALKGKLAASSELMTVLKQGEVLKQQCRAAVTAARSNH